MLVSSFPIHVAKSLTTTCIIALFCLSVAAFHFACVSPVLPIPNAALPILNKPASQRSGTCNSFKEFNSCNSVCMSSTFEEVSRGDIPSSRMVLYTARMQTDMQLFFTLQKNSRSYLRMHVRVHKRDVQRGQGLSDVRSFEDQVRAQDHERHTLEADGM